MTMRAAAALFFVLGLGLGVTSCDDGDGEDQCPDEHDRAGDLSSKPRAVLHDHDHEENDSCGEATEFGPPTESVCPEGSTLSWESFGQEFMAEYCTRCHSSELMGDARQGAPLYHDFDTLMGVLVVADHVDRKAAAGPAATNELMPISAPVPTLEERQQLGEWLACEIEKM